MFDEEGSAFSSYYYGQNEAPYFPSDIDDYALRRFGPKEYFAEKYQDETYPIPFDEVDYQDMARLIQQRWEAWQQYEPSDEEPDELAQATMQYLGCDCEYFPPTDAGRRPHYRSVQLCPPPGNGGRLPAGAGGAQ